MHLRLAFLLTLLFVSGVIQCQVVEERAVRLKPGDVITVTVVGAPTYSGDYTVLTDGSIVGKGFARLEVAGLTLEQGRRLLTTRLQKWIKDPTVYVQMRAERPQFVFVIGTDLKPAAGSDVQPIPGAIPYVPGMTLRQILALASLPAEPDLLTLRLFRRGESAKEFDAVAASTSQVGSYPIQPDDVLNIMLKPYVRVWVTGSVAKPGQYRVNLPADPYTAIASAGGLAMAGGTSASSQVPADQDVSIVLIRGGKEQRLPARQDVSATPIQLEAGDTIVVQPKRSQRVTVTGEVEQPGEYVLRGEGTLNAAVALAGGQRPTATLTNVVVLRKGEVFQINASQLQEGAKPFPFAVEDGDLIIVRKNEATVIVLGEVKNPGRLLLPDNKTYRATEALALSGGLAEKGTLRRVYLARANWDGRLVVSQFNLDEFVKDGNLEANPILQPGDVLLFGQPKGIALSNLSQVISGALLVESLLRR